MTDHPLFFNISGSYPKEPLSETSLEDLYVAIKNLKTVSGLPTDLQPEDVLQSWVTRQVSVFTIKIQEK